ncbi:cGMP-dependent 3',5'-cyclic phosphodiesterase [Exaiptasia diaphana]|nr:cGMP-dependent 3',5'-cyclic phosphodiesterase [Exaiptasia diaphana]
MVIKRQQEKLLQVAKNLFTHADDVSLLLNEIMTEARNLTNAERCSLFMLDHEHNELVAKVFDGEIPGNGKHKEGWDLTIPLNQGIVGHVAVTGKLLNIKDTYNHPLFYRGLDEKTGFRTKSVLCFPIKGEQGVLGVAELCNKVNGGCFTKFDEDLTKAFAIYCGISIFQSMLYKKASSESHRSQLTSEMMIYHMNVPQEEVDNLLKVPIQNQDQFSQDFSKFDYMPRTLLVEQTVPAVLYMMDDLGFIERWKIPKEILIRFTLMVKRGYREPPYHNWYHAFTVAHFCYLLYKNTDMDSRLTDIEKLALFVSCLCHDLDHRGTNNAFQVTSNSTLAALYSSEGSVMERHHFAQTMCIVNSPGCNIFKNLSEKNFAKVLDSIRTIILATDLAHHLKILKDIRRMAQDGYKSDREDHHKLLLCLMMTASDLSDQTKPWKGTRKIADLIYTEFFSQGDLEKVMGYTPSEMMDRERACIPKLQIDFLESIAFPVYSALGDIIPETSVVHESVLSNRDHWKVVQEENEQKGVIEKL